MLEKWRRPSAFENERMQAQIAVADSALDEQPRHRSTLGDCCSNSVRMQHCSPMTLPPVIGLSRKVSARPHWQELRLLPQDGRCRGRTRPPSAGNRPRSDLPKSLPGRFDLPDFRGLSCPVPGLPRNDPPRYLLAGSRDEPRFPWSSYRPPWSDRSSTRCHAPTVVG